MRFHSPPNKCPLKHGYRRPSAWTKSTLRRACGHVGCLGCDQRRAKQFIKANRRKGQVIETRMVRFSLKWPSMSASSHHWRRVEEFLLACDEVVNRRTHKAMKGTVGHLLRSRYGAIPYSREFRPVAHLSVFLGTARRDEFHQWLAERWSRLGGARASMMEETRSLSSVLKRCAKLPLEGLSEVITWPLCQHLLSRVENSTEEPAVRYLVGGEALSESGFQKLEARARWEAGCPEPGDEEHKDYLSEFLEVRDH